MASPLRSPTKPAAANRPLPTIIPSLLALVAAALLLLILVGGSPLSGFQGLNKMAGLSQAVGAGGPEPAAPVLPGTTLAALTNCSDFRCLRAAHALPRGPGQTFNFPHFFIIGFPKCATTSLAAYLQRHPLAVGSQPKETRFFNIVGNCSHPGSATRRWGCDKAQEARYLQHTLGQDQVVQSGLARAAFEATTDYAWQPGVVAAGIRRELPWLKLVVSMREPISAEISGLVHRMEVLARPAAERAEWFMPEAADECLDSLRLGNNSTSISDCLRIKLDEKDPGVRFDYSRSMAAWLHTFPAEQFYVMQYENVTAPGSRDAVLSDMQRFLGLDPDLAPAELPSENSRKGSEHPQGWPMRRDRYQEYVDTARTASQRLAAVLDQHGLKSGQEWVEVWEAAWARNLATCDASGDCLIQLT